MQTWRNVFHATILFIGLAVLASPNVVAEPADFLAFIKSQGESLRANDVAPTNSDEWQARRMKLRQILVEAWGGFPAEPCELAPRKLGELKRDGYRVEKIVFQTRPGMWMTANAYVPEPKDADKSPKKNPTVLCVHGHWAGAKQDPVVQSRCIGLVKHGFFVLVVDAFGAGERGIGKQLGQYHGEMTGATLLPIGLPLSGLQVYENMRAVDYLRTRPEVDPDRIGITGASGGGNQSMYAGAFDERFKCVVPTCSVGTYQAYLGAACCMCEVVPGAMRFTEEGDLLGLAAARGLMVTSATKDAFQFSVGEAKKSFARATDIATVLGKVDGIKHTIIESPHHYNQPMREAMYGWMTRHLKGTGDGSPIAEPEIKTEEPEMLRCYPGESRPDDYLTIPRFAVAEAKRLAEHPPMPKSPHQALATALGGKPNLDTKTLSSGSGEFTGETYRQTFESEPGIKLQVLLTGVPRTSQPPDVKKLAVVLDLEQTAEQTLAGELAKKLRADGWAVAVPEMRAVGAHAVVGDKIGAAADHNSAEWALWIGRPLLGQWVRDVHCSLSVLSEHLGKMPREVLVIGNTTAGLVALTAAALDQRITHAMTVNSLASYVTDEPYRNQRLGLMVPGILRDVGDVADIATLIAPRKITIIGGVRGGGATIHGDDLEREFRSTRRVFLSLSAGDKFRVVPDGMFDDVVR